MDQRILFLKGTLIFQNLQSNIFILAIETRLQIKVTVYCSLPAPNCLSACSSKWLFGFSDGDFDAFDDKLDRLSHVQRKVEENKSRNQNQTNLDDLLNIGEVDRQSLINFDSASNTTVCSTDQVQGEEAGLRSDR